MRSPRARVYGGLSSAPPRVVRVAGVCAAMSVCGAALGCDPGDAPPATPEATVIAFARALNSSKPEAAYALMSNEYKQRVSFDQFKKKLEGNAQETLEISNALGHVRKPAEQ